TTNDGATNAGQDGKTAIDKVSAKAAIDGALAEKNNLIDAAPNLTDEEKQSVKDQANKAADNAKSAIKTAQDNDAVKQAQTKGVNNINGIKVPEDSQVKQDAKDAIDQAAKTKDAAIDASNLTAEEKADLKKTVAGEVQKDNAAIDAATKDADVTTAKNTGVGKINNVNVPTASATKAAAKDAIDQAAKAKNDAIDASNLTAEEKDTLKQTVADKVNKANAAIDAATKDADVKTAQTNGEQAINAVEIPASVSKTDAINAINATLAAKKGAINGTNLTTEEKTALVNQAQKLADDAIANINKATTNDAVKTAKENGVEKINNVNVPTTSATKAAAKDAIDQAAKTKDDAIDASNLTAEEKDALKKTVAGEVQTAKAAIDAAKKADDVTTAKNTGVGKINNVNVPTTSATKDAAISAIKTALAAKKGAINGTNLTDEEKTALVNQAQQLADDAITNINKATTNEAVNTAKKNGVQAINAVEIPTSSKTKNDANSDLKNTADAAKKAIDENSGLTADQKQTAKNQIDQAVTDAQENIKKASDNQGVADAKDAGKLAIDKVSEKAAIDVALNNKKSEINGATNIDQTTKDNLIKEATDAADKAKNAIDQATTADAIKKAQDDGISNINNLNQGTDATKDNVQNSNSNGKVTNVDDQGNTTITYPDGSKNTISGDDYTYDDYAYNDFYQVIIKANAVEVYTLPKGNLTKEKKLVHDTVLTVLETKKIDGQVWYRIGTNRWIMAATTIKVGELENFKLKRLSKKTKTTAIVWVNKLAIYNNVNGKMTKKHLTRGTKVRIYAIATINSGEWYKIGKNKWIPAAGVHELTVEPL
ncbi:DUF1542 domain-containing protein, partial [Lactobacillus gallinarum]|uniref:DUF1542 domain-containing protein n=1 Tax=Lactobacillus gallinarum TaxID=52242 RepID=UPI00242DC8FA